MSKWRRIGIGLLFLGVVSLLTISHSVAVARESIWQRYRDESSSQTQGGWGGQSPASVLSLIRLILP
ncbi:hypothetical protein AmaxDRAFT_2151 [Limnospira maxima CS-328]|uniref:Uncharacterized protein n=1 Tax=Limnospira maxima CS-328 TaxID=513049 RepID=B5W059_LIMMA|nr:hypothetical protein AmaxDRAFT_2151 [Limnospira maxima CS-328]